MDRWSEPRALTRDDLNETAGVLVGGYIKGRVWATFLILALSSLPALFSGVILAGVVVMAYAGPILIGLAVVAISLAARRWSGAIAEDWRGASAFRRARIAGLAAFALTALGVAATAYFGVENAAVFAQRAAFYAVALALYALLFLALGKLRPALTRLTLLPFAMMNRVKGPRAAV